MGEAADVSAGTMLARLVMWAGLGLFGCVGILVCGLRDDWIGFVPCLIFANASIFTLGSGLWMRWPRG